MHIKEILIISLLLMSCTVLYGQKKFKVVEKETDTWRSIYSLIDEQGKVIRELDTAKYYMCFNTDQYVYFGIFGVKGRSGWTAIDADENILFKIYNTSFGEPSPDYLVENKIRIVDEQEKIGFANNKGEIIIRPQYEMATAFHKGKAIIGEKCRKVPWGEHEKESGCHHYSIECGKYGYINEKGKELKMGTFSFEQIMKEINWKMPED